MNENGTVTRTWSQDIHHLVMFAVDKYYRETALGSLRNNPDDGTEFGSKLYKHNKDIADKLESVLGDWHHEFDRYYE